MRRRDALQVLAGAGVILGLFAAGQVASDHSAVGQELPPPDEPTTEALLRHQLATERERAAEQRMALVRQVKLARSDARRWRVAVRHDAEVQSALILASHVYGVPLWELRRVAFCESTNVRTATNGQYKGLFQLGNDFRGRQTPWFPRLDWRDPYANTFAAARVVARDGWSQWECSPRGKFRR